MGFLYYLLIIFVALLFIGFSFIKTPMGKGMLGELLVKRYLKNITKYDRSIHNLMFTINDKSVQIDHIYINHSGVYVIETKNYSGRIYGRESQDEWTQVLAYGKVKNHFYSPIKQNSGHLYNLRQIMSDFPDIKLFSIIVFMHSASLYVETQTPVIGISKLRKTIQNSNSSTSLSNNEVERIYQFLLNLKNTNEVSLHSHVKQINKRKKDYEKNICPYCGAQLVLKSSKSGSFYGCSNYPKCKFTKKA